MKEPGTRVPGLIFPAALKACFHKRKEKLRLGMSTANVRLFHLSHLMEVRRKAKSLRQSSHHLSVNSMEVRRKAKSLRQSSHHLSVNSMEVRRKAKPLRQSSHHLSVVRITAEHSRLYVTDAWYRDRSGA